jgi:hypothetical protein
MNNVLRWLVNAIIWPFAFVEELWIKYNKKGKT